MVRDASLAVVIVCFNTREHLAACLATVLPESPRQVVVADNGSADGSIAMVRQQFPSVVVDVDGSNPGYGAAANRGIRRCGTADVLLLNSDTRLRSGALARLRAYLDAHPRAGIVGPRLLNADGTLQPSCLPFPSALRPPCERNLLEPLVRRIPKLRERCLSTWSHAQARVVPAVMGAALAIRRAAFDAVGGFDERFFMYAEETDLCFRMSSAAWETHFAPVTDIVHIGRASTRQRRVAMLEQSALSSIQFVDRHYSGRQHGGALFAIRCGMAVRMLRDQARYFWATDGDRRRELAENLGVWRRVLLALRGTPAT